MSPMHPKGYGSLNEETAKDPKKLAAWDKFGEEFLDALRRGIAEEDKENESNA